MSLLRRTRCSLFSSSLTRSLRRQASTRARLNIPSAASSRYPVIESCPSPTCACQPHPTEAEMQGNKIDREANLYGSMAAYAEQILISTGKDDWKSRIEEDEDGEMVRQVKKVLGRDGPLEDPFHNVMITTSSFPPTSSAAASAFLFPSFRYIPSIPLDTEHVSDLIKGFVKPINLNDQQKKFHPPEKQKDLVRDEALQSKFSGVREVDEIVVLICGHGGRDLRCGVLAPLLRAEFKEKLEMKGIPIRSQPVLSVPQDEMSKPKASIGSISHIGGHKWAGNVIIYIPKTLRAINHPLAGKGIWYGRVGPEQVEGIVEETIVQGKIIKELFRGGIEDNEPRTLI
ncbi:hypothetical protein K490DRAFT_49284 [Saccharata proteae CBS 121410]|uniref:Altered inheritance of mitochondria protein 32 n=1 Tax=Saccharata proteae CBS 121410 TaxID=1314787 RepID=A0A9P4LWV6_9PEZI|nr:hypothetical protein K490DRAFT_49284 [Saccharata proteae CBS 121410]